MDADTAFFALLAVASTFMFVVLGSLLVEAIVGRRYRPLDRLDAARTIGAGSWWAAFWLIVFGVLVGIVQVAFVAALLEPSVPPLTKVIAAIELVLLIGWIAAMIRFAASPTS